MQQANRVINCGIETQGSITFKEWAVGQEYTKQLVLKNVQYKAVRISLTPPTASAFTAPKAPQQPINISAGTTFTLPIVFRPTEKSAYAESVQVSTPLGNFEVPLRAPLPSVDLALPSSVDLGLVAVGLSASKTFKITNNSSLPTTWRLSVPDTFTLAPLFGDLPSNGSAQIVATFNPVRAGVFEGDALLRYDAGEEHVGSLNLKLQGQAKFPYLQASTDGASGSQIQLDFGEVLAADRALQRPFRLKNTSPVPAEITIHQSFLSQPAFRILSNPGRIAPGETVEMRIEFDAKRSGITATEYFDIKVLHGNSIRVMCSCTTIGPNVVLDTSTLQFDVCTIGSSTIKTLQLTNTTKVPTRFQFNIGHDCAFRIDQPSGTLGALETKAIACTFTPSAQVPYFRNISVSIHQHSILNVLCFGVGKDPAAIVSAPVPLSEQSVKLMENLVAQGISRYAPSQLESMLRDGQLLLGDNKEFIKPAPRIPLLGPTLEEPSEDASGELAGGSNGSIQATASTTTSATSASNPSAGGNNGNELAPPSSAHPPATPSSSSQRISRAQSRIQNVSRGGVESSSSNSRLAATSSKNRSSLMEDDSSRSSLDEAADAAERNLPHEALVAVDKFCVNFGSCPSGSKKQVATIPTQSLVLTNHTKAPVMCSWTSLPSDSSFTLSPGSAEIPGGESRSFQVSFAPVYPEQHYRADIECYASFKEAVDGQLQEHVKSTPLPWTFSVHVCGHTFAGLAASSSASDVKFSSRELSFAPSLLGTPAYRTFVIANNGQTTATFDFNIPFDGVPAWTCFPSRGTIAPGQEHLVTVALVLPAEGEAKCLLPCIVNGTQSREHDILLSGSAHLPRLSIEGGNPAVFLAPTCVGNETSATLSLRNVSLVAVGYDIRLPQHAIPRDVLLSVSPSKGLLKPNETCTLMWRFAPSVAAKETIPVVCVYYPSGSSVPGTSALGQAVKESTETIQVHVESVLGRVLATPSAVDAGLVAVGDERQVRVELENPTSAPVRYEISHNGGSLLRVHQAQGLIPARSRRPLDLTLACRREQRCRVQLFCKVVTAEGEGAEEDLLSVSFEGMKSRLLVSDIKSEGVSKSQLWQMFQIPSLNEGLNPALGEGPPKTIFEFDFGSMPLESVPRNVVVVLTNHSPCATDWSLAFPSDLNWIPERWAANPNPSEDAAHESLVLEKHLFAASPKSGHLAPGASASITLSYAHSLLGAHCLKVLFQQSSGNDVSLLFSGKTVTADAGHLHFSSATHNFEPIALGLLSPPIQHFVLHNPTDCTVDFKLDLSDVKRLVSEHYNFPILECGLESGSVPPRGSTIVPWRFQPLEEREYEASVPISILGGSSTTVRFVGRGYDPRGRPVGKRYADGREQIPLAPSVFLLPAQLASLSEDRMNCFDVPLLGVVRRIVFVRNMHPEDEIAFKWDVGAYKSVVKVEPKSGVVAPGQSSMCRVTFVAGDGVRIYDFDVVCRVTNRNRQEDFARRMMEYQRSEEEADASFTYTDKGRTGRGRTGGFGDTSVGPSVREARGLVVDASDLPSRVLSNHNGFTPALSSSLSHSMRGDRPTSAGKRLLPVTGKKQFALSDTDLRTTRYQALPPIRVNGEKRVGTPPSADPHFELFFGISAWVHDPDMLRERLGRAEFDSFFQDRSHWSVAAPSPAPAPELRQLWSDSNGEARAVYEVLEMMVHGILADTDFLESVAEIEHETVPAFRDLAPQPDIPDASVDPDIVPSDFLIMAEDLLNETICSILAEASSSLSDIFGSESA